MYTHNSLSLLYPWALEATFCLFARVWLSPVRTCCPLAGRQKGWKTHPYLFFFFSSCGGLMHPRQELYLWATAQPQSPLYDLVYPKCFFHSLSRNVCYSALVYIYEVLGLIPSTEKKEEGREGERKEGRDEGRPKKEGKNACYSSFLGSGFLLQTCLTYKANADTRLPTWSKVVHHLLTG